MDRSCLFLSSLCSQLSLPNWYRSWIYRMKKTQMKTSIVNPLLQCDAFRLEVEVDYWTEDFRRSLNYLETLWKQSLTSLVCCLHSCDCLLDSSLLILEMTLKWSMAPHRLQEVFATGHLVFQCLTFSIWYSTRITTILLMHNLNLSILYH